jgi:hypothetical protein
MFCPQCGTENPTGSRYCKKCGSALPALPENQTPVDQPIIPVKTEQQSFDPEGSWWGNLPPDFRSALIVTLAIFIIGLLSDLVPGLGFLVSIPFSILTYYLQGVLTGRFAKRDPRYAQRKFFLLGLRSGFWTGVVFSTIFTLIALAIQFTFTLGTALAYIPLILTQSMMDILLNLFFSGLGAWLFQKMGGKRMILASIGIVGCGSMLALAIILGLILLLGFLGWQIFKDILNPPTGKQLFDLLPIMVSYLKI